MGRVTKIAFDSKEYKAVVTLRMDARYTQIPTDSDASIYTQGLLGGKFIGITAGGAETYLKDKDQIDFTQSAFVLENLIGQVLANFTKSAAQPDSGKIQDRCGPACRTQAYGEIEMIKTTLLAVLLALAAVGVARRRSRRRRLPHPRALWVLRNWWRIPPRRMLVGTGRKSCRCMRRIPQSWMPWWPTCCCRISTPSMRRGWCWGRRGAPRLRSSANDSSMRSTIRCCATMAPRWSTSRPIASNILPYKGDPNDTMATVRTEVKRSSGDKVPVNFSLRKTDGVWKAWDVVIEGISYVKSFRTDFGAEIQQKGLDEVINRLETSQKTAPGVSSH